MPQIFLSYKHESADIRTARRLYEDLSKAGHTVFFDEHIPAGEDFGEVIRKRLKDCDAFIVLVSRAANVSQWVRTEVIVANRLSTRGGGRPRIIPLILEEFQDDWNMHFSLALSERNFVHCLDPEAAYPDVLRRILDELASIGRDPGEGAADAGRAPAGREAPAVGPAAGFAEVVLGLVQQARRLTDRRQMAEARNTLELCGRLMEQAGAAVAPAVRARVLNEQAYLSACERDPEGAWRHVEDARRLLAGLDEPALVAENERVSAYLRLQRGEVYDALKHLERADDLSRRHGLEELRGHLQDMLGNAWASLGFLDVALEHYGNSLEIKERIGDRQGMAITHGNLGRACERQGRLADAREHFEKDRNLCLEIDDHHGVLLMRSHLAWLYLLEQRYDESLRAFEDIRRRAEEDGVGSHVAVAQLGMARVWMALGDFAESERWLIKAGGFGEPWFRPNLLKASGELSMRSKDFVEAACLFREAVETMEAQRAQPHELVEALMDLALAQARQGVPGEAEQSARRAWSVVREKKLRWLIPKLRGLDQRLGCGEGAALESERMPFPVLLAARRVDAELVSEARVEHLLHLLKVTLKLAAAVTVSEYRVLSEARSPEIDAALAKLLRRPSLGHWVEALRIVVQRTAASGEGLRVPCLPRIFCEGNRGQPRLRGPLQVSISEALEARNTLSHALSRELAECERVAEKLDRSVRAVVKALEPLWACEMVVCRAVEGALRWRGLTGPGSLTKWPEVEAGVEGAFADGDVALRVQETGAFVGLGPWWVARWRDRPSDRGDLFLYSRMKRSGDQARYLDTETGVEVDLPVHGI